MSKPREDWKAPIHGASHELVSAMSALNMEPSPIKSPDETAIYLSETDEMARHSYEHMQAAMTCLIKAQQQLENLQKRCLKMGDTNVHEEYEVKVHDPQLGLDVSLCGLCGNTGHIRTVAVVSPKGLPVPSIYKPCICPNGRAYRNKRRA